MNMKSLKIWGIGALLTLGAPTLSAQNGILFEGEVMQQSVLSGEAAARLSQPQLFGTARSMAMANAFVSLGADMASMSINPAGLGMYRHNELSITPLITSAHSSNSAAGYDRNGKTRFGLANLGAVYNLYEGTGRVVSVNLGLGYNRIADLNYRTSFCYDSPYSGSKAPSVLDLMAGQLTVNGLYPDANEFLGYYGENFPDLWGAMMAYNSYLINPYLSCANSGCECCSGGICGFGCPECNNNCSPFWEADRVGSNAAVGHFYDLESRGSVGEFDLSFGMNVDNRFYVGATIGIQSLSQRINLYYGEDYLYSGAAVNGGGDELIEQADYMHYNQAAELSGIGINFKLGFIYRPIPSLRLGFALHTPTYWSIDHTYAGQMSSMRYNNDEDKYYASNLDTDGSWTDSGDSGYRLSAPTRLMFGVSYALGSRAILSVDYERDWYNGLRMKQYPLWVPDRTSYSKTEFKRKFCATNTLRIGAEFKPTERWALRAGFSYTSSMIRSKSLTGTTPMPDRVLYCTAGTGFALSRRVTLDLAYQYCRTDNDSYRLFYSAERTDTGGLSLLDASEPVSTDYMRHNVALSLSVKF